MATKNTLRITLLTLAALVIFVLMALYFTSGEPLFDFTAFWIAGNLILNGQDPYHISDWLPIYGRFENLGMADNQTFLYPKPILPLFIPFGALPLETASFLWVLLTQIAVLVSVLLLARLWKEDKPARYLLPFLVGVLLFRPYLLTLDLGQLGGFFLLVMVGALLLWEKQRWLAGGILLSLLTLKPSLGFPIIALVSVWFLFHKKWHHFLGLSIGGLALLVVGWLFDHHWIWRFLQIGTGKITETFGFHPTLWGLSGYLCHHEQSCALFSGGLITALFLGAFLWFVWDYRQRLTPFDLMAISIALALWLTPYLWAYDQLLLVIPLAAVIGRLIKNRSPYLLIASLPILLAVVSMLFLNLAVKLDNDAWSGLVPLLTLVLVSLPILIPPKKEPLA